jgi:small subunit ribosomal protein S4|tara:strand:- start:1273 stop:1884 length:612 start_codon:yes stop_codon:yes gene_type:complete
MSRYLGPKLKITRRLGTLPGFTQKISNRKKTPGQHGTEINPDTSASSNYGQRLMEKQKLRFNYGISESKLLSYVNKAKKKQGSTGILLLQMLELRLDNIVYKLGFAPTIQASRQMVKHRHILVNNQSVNIPSFQCTVGDEITLKPKSKFFESMEIAPNGQAKYLEFIANPKKKQYLGIVKQIPDRTDTELEINELFVIEYYSR